jgi:hypothetical protein
MKILTRDDTEHDVEYVTRADAEREIEAWKEKAEHWKSLCTLYADERNELRDAVTNLRDVKGRHHTELAARELYALFPENVLVSDAADKNKP